ncbi:hypothetical protein SUGI_0363720 [Cryptomeria japonica]|nr:hypothetical protein SUGI_0363720 [Cryptomeria japonica]
MPPEWNSFIESGDKFLSFVNEQKEKFGETVDLFKSDGQVLGVISGILEEVGKTHWAVAGLSMIGHLLTKVCEMSDNQDECLKLLQYMLDLAEHINKLQSLLPQENEKLTNALVVIVKGSMLCAKQLHSKKLFRFLKSSLDSKNLSSLPSEIDGLYPDLELTVGIATLQVSMQQPQRKPVSQPECPSQAGIYK